jgi:23S rRNA-/tRNA-specific pseudouridylate synthase
MIKNPRAPKTLSNHQIENTVQCELNVLNGKQNHFLFDDIKLNSQIKTSLLEIELLTGRTHQIRAQLSHVGFPIVGDVAYGSQIQFPTRDLIFLRAHYLNFKYRDQPLQLISKSQFKIQ